MTVLIGGLRAININADGSKNGVFTAKPGALTNDFFANLLDMGTEWKPVSDAKDLFEGRDRTTGAVLNEINTPLGIGWFGPWEPAVSPDGTKVAYEIRDFNGYPAVAYSNTDGSIVSRPLHTGWTWPAWIDDEWLIHSEKPNALAKDTIVRQVGSPNNTGTPWFTHPGRTPLADVDIKGNLFAGITDEYKLCSSLICSQNHLRTDFAPIRQFCLLSIRQAAPPGTLRDVQGFCFFR